MKILTILKFIGAGILALLAGVFGLKQGKRSADKKVQMAEKRADESKVKEQASIQQTMSVIEVLEKSRQIQRETVENVKDFDKSIKQIQEIQEEADEKTQDIINSDITDKLKFMRNESSRDSKN